MKCRISLFGAVAGLLAVCFTSCASTKIASQVNPEVVGRSFSKVLVYGNFSSLSYQQLAEEKLCAGLTQEVDCACVKTSEVFFPTQQYSDEDIAKRLDELGIEAVLTLQSAGSGTSSTYVPQTSHTTGTATVTGNTVTGSSTTQTYGGHDVNKPWANFEADLWSRVDKKIAWYATASSGGNAFANWNDLIASAANKAVSRLLSCIGSVET